MFFYSPCSQMGSSSSTAMGGCARSNAAGGAVVDVTISSSRAAACFQQLITKLKQPWTRQRPQPGCPHPQYCP